MDDLQRTEKTIAKILKIFSERGIKAGHVDLTDEVGDPTLQPYVAACYFWLEAEGIVRARNSQETLHGTFSLISPSLTSFGFRILGEPTSLLNGRKKLSEAVQEVATSERSYSQLGDFFGGILGGFTKSLGS